MDSEENYSESNSKNKEEEQLKVNQKIMKTL